jgi:hypothetical protein
MRSLKVRRGRKFQARQCEEDLIRGQTSIFRGLGGDNYIQTQIIREIQLSLSANPNSKIALLHGRPRVQASRAWVHASTYVTRFLQRFAMRQALAAITDENNGRELETDESADFGGNMSKYVTGAVKRARRRPRFAARVAHFEKEWAKRRAAQRAEAAQKEVEASFVQSDGEKAGRSSLIESAVSGFEGNGVVGAARMGLTDESFLRSSDSQ